MRSRATMAIGEDRNWLSNIKYSMETAVVADA